MSRKFKATLCWILLLFLGCTVIQLVTRFATGNWEYFGVTICFSALLALMSGGNFWIGYSMKHMHAKKEATKDETETKTE